MGSGISLNKDQVIFIIKRELAETLNKNHTLRPRYDENGYEIHYGFADEEELIDMFNEIDMYRRKELRIGLK